jgi:hypothetical protein
MSKTSIAAVAAALASAVWSWPAAAAQDSPFPNFSPDTLTGWVPATYGDLFDPPLGGPGPVVDDPAHPFVSNREFGSSGKQPTFHIADLSNPILQPWARDELRKRNEHILSGKPGLSVQASCIPLGVPAYLLHPVQPLYFIQTPRMVLLVNQEDLETRRVYLNVPHSAQVTPSWYGESVGHYEGDTLVVDTIGMNGKTYIDNFRTPHSEKLHVIERFRMTGEGKTLEASIHVEDTGAFTTPWSATQHWRRVEQGPIYERFCAEASTDFFHLEMEPIPEDTTPDF